MTRLAFSAVLFSTFFLGQYASAVEPQEPPELKVLERFVGTWDCELVTKPALWTPKETHTKSVEVNEMALDGWFLHGCSKTPDGKTLAILMNTYDPAQKKYRIWRFAGKGCEKLTGTWDEANSTLTITTDLGNGITSRATFQVIDTNHREYNIIAKDGGGKIYIDIHGKATRRKLAPAQPTAKAAARAAQLEAAIKLFTLEVCYQGDQIDRYDSLLLSVPVRRYMMPRNWRIVDIKEAQAKKIIDYLATDGFLDQAHEGVSKRLPKQSDYYTLLVRANGEGKSIMFEEALGWESPVLKRLDGLRTVLEGDAAKEMDNLLGKLDALRKEGAKTDKAVAGKPNVAIRNFVSGIRRILPKGWECLLIEEKGKMGHPHGLDEPLFRVDFVNSKESFEYSSPPSKARRLQPSLRLHFHPVADRQNILKVIEAERMYSWEIPVSFAETKKYLIVTSPAWINQGHYNDEAKELMAPLEEALKKHFAGQK